MTDKIGPFENTLNKIQKKNYPVRKPGSVPPKTKTIQKYNTGGPVKVRPRVETFEERLSRLLYEYEDGPKPPHYDNPNIIDMENAKQPPKKFDNNDPSTYLSERSQRQKSVGREAIMSSARGNPKEMKEVREILRKSYKSNPELLTDQEKKMIGVYKKPKQENIINTNLNIFPEPTKDIKFDPPIKEPKPVIPEKPLNEIIKERANLRKELEVKQLENQFGPGGLVNIIKDRM